MGGSSFSYIQIEENYFQILWTECDKIIGTSGARKCASFIVVGIAVSLRALILENLGILCRRTSIWGTKISGATVLRLIESLTCALASDYAAIKPFHSQLRRANLVHIPWTTCALATSRPALWAYRQGQVKAIDKADIVEILSTAAI
jgi:hypothetical protein